MCFLLVYRLYEIALRHIVHTSLGNTGDQERRGFVADAAERGVSNVRGSAEGARLSDCPDRHGGRTAHRPGPVVLSALRGSVAQVPHAVHHRQGFISFLIQLLSACVVERLCVTFLSPISCVRFFHTAVADSCIIRAERAGADDSTTEDGRSCQPEPAQTSFRAAGQHRPQSR